MHQYNPNTELDFISGLREPGGSNKKWIQRLTDSYGLVLTLSGEGQVSFGEESLPLNAGDMILMHPGVQHRFQGVKNFAYLWFHFIPRSHISRALDWPEQIPGLGKVTFDKKEFRRIQEDLREAHSLEYERPAGWNDLAYLLLESAVVRGYNRILKERSPDDPQIRTARKLLTESGESIDRIAKRCGISRAAFYSKFKHETGISPRQYREYSMLRLAAHLLESTTLSIAEIADRSGIPDPYYFSTRFHKFFGASPREYRKEKLFRKNLESNPSDR